MGRQRGGSAQERFEYKSAIDMAKALQPLRRPLSEQPKTLTSEEQEMLAQCKAAVDTLQWAFWLAGKALENIREGRLYRVEADSFDEYVWKHWRMRKAYANKLIRTWRIAEATFEVLEKAVAPIGATAKKQTALSANAEKALRALNQAQVWELVPVADAWDVDAAVLVYQTLVEVDGVSVTAKVLKGAVEALPEGDFDAEQVIDHVRAYLESLREDEEEDDEPFDFAAQVEKAVPSRWMRRLARKDSAAAHRYLDELQAHIDKVRSELKPTARKAKAVPEARGSEEAPAEQHEEPAAA